MQFTWFALKNPDLLAEQLANGQVEIIAPSLHGIAFPSRIVSLQLFRNAAQLEPLLLQLREEREQLEHHAAALSERSL